MEPRGIPDTKLQPLENEEGGRTMHRARINKQRARAIIEPTFCRRIDKTNEIMSSARGMSKGFEAPETET